jgi:transcriptional regulator with AAA-type ATPase domain
MTSSTLPRAAATATLSVTDDARDAGAVPLRPHLFLVLESHRPLAAPARFELSGLAEIVVGRGTAREIELHHGPSGARLAVRLDDPWMSSTHARLTRVLRRWVLEDAGSKNGSLVNGVATTRAELADGDVVELGRTFFVFREALPSAPGEAPVLDTATVAPAAPGLATLLPSLGQVFAQLPLVARTSIPVILEGETGTGKEVMARALHALSGRAGDFVAVNCGALPAALVEGELFGHRKGAFSGATEDRIGLVRSAEKGTLLLDEIGDLPLGSQAAFLRVLQEREVRAVGATRAVAVDFRLIAATHRALDQMVAAGAFRADLQARITGYRLALPPLRERREDLGLLLGALLRRLAPDRVAPIHPRAVRALLRHSFPGNVRELEQCLGTALVLAGTGPLDLEHLPAAVQRAMAEPDAEGDAEDTARRAEIVALLQAHDGNIAAVARATGKARMQVQRWLKRYAIDAESFRPR